ncbi:biopolymer transporter ExbD [Fibrella forsythiae]|uniref:Biopolymer transporter ExbD n=1 Tax=Fibrella forsythiae TaxID=2817061 RepID=A0ABS3JEG3_9BACT|nr:biopolymer transporter ExbD [Fibrella forsythiae]MBO0948386.1 biopolymer transporter ExbD [Fibrella forsythiae]
MRRTRHTRQLPRADMTPLVNIALLLIVFFVWVKQLQRPVVVPVHVSLKGKYDAYEPVNATLFLLDHNRIGVLTYLPDGSSAEFQEVDYSVDGLRSKLTNITLAKGAIVSIAPMGQSTCKNLVDVLNEVKLNGRITYELNYKLSLDDEHMISSYQQLKKRLNHKPILLKLPIYPEQIIDA